MPLENFALTTVAVVEEAFGLTPGVYTAQIERAINAASARLEALTNRKLKSRTYTDQFYDGTGSHYLCLPQYPVTEVTSVEIFDDFGILATTINPLDLEQLKIEEEGFLYSPTYIFWCGVNNIVVTYTAGFLTGTHIADLLNLEQAVLDFIALFGVPGEIRRDPSIRREALGAYSISYFDITATASGKVTWPSSIQSVIDAYYKYL